MILVAFSQYWENPIKLQLIPSIYPFFSQSGKTKFFPVDVSEKKAEYHHLNTALLQNGYPSKFIRKHSTVPPRSKINDEETTQSKGFASLPYVKGTTERIRKVLTTHNIKCCMRPDVTLKRILSHPKDRIETEKRVGVVYSIPCGECNVRYVGETGRALKTRKREHVSAVRQLNTKKSALAEHVNTTGHGINWAATSIVQNETKYQQRKWLEACEISRGQDVLFNRDRGRTLPGNYLCLVKVTVTLRGPLRKKFIGASN